MSERAAYSRVYWSIMDDQKFDGIREDVRHLGSWALLLIVADMAWPAPAFVPPSIPRGSFRALVSAELVDELPGGRFRIHGLNAERNRRKEAATRPGGSRPPTGPQPGPKRDPNGAQDEDETRRDEISRAEDTARANDPWDNPEAVALAWLSRHGCDIRPGNGWHQKLILAIEQHGSEAVVGMFDRLAEAGTKQGDTKGFLFGAIDALNARTRPNLRALEAEERQGELSENVDRRVLATLVRVHENGGHVEPHARCPRCAAA